MGMDYQYSGSASYPRFDKEIFEVVKLLGGVKTSDLIDHEKEVNTKPCGYWFGGMSSMHDNNNWKYQFPLATNELVVKFFNNLYSEYNEEETKIIYNSLLCYKESIEEISSQFWTELENLVMYEEGWYIS